MYCAIATKAELIEDMILASIFDCFLSGELPASNQSFADCLKKNEDQFIDHANKLAEVTHQLLSDYQAAINAIDNSELPVDHRADMHEQCGNLVYDGFLRDISMPNLSRMSVYFQAIQKRITNYKSGSTQIDNLHTLVRKFWDKYLELSERDKIDTVKLEQFRWMIEEFRIACFAQPMKTKMPVSEKRLDTLFTSIGP
jgi:ATP-dependent helicase HrpA